MKKALEFLQQDWVSRVWRTFLISFLVLAIPGGLGWLHGVTEWASTQGQQPFPDPSNLSYLLVQAVVAGFIALGNLVWNWVEQMSGKGLGRDTTGPADPLPKGGLYKQ